MTEHFLVWVSWPDQATAQGAAKSLLSQQLAACISILPNVISHYTWENELCEENEVLMLIKTSANRYSELEASITALHPYEVPEIIASGIQQGYSPYLKWINESTQK